MAQNNVMHDMEPQPISEEHINTILTLHQRRLGWGYLLQCVIDDRSVGFPCEREELAIRREYKNATQKVSRWFQAMGRQNSWPSKAGWMWEIDFKSSQAVPKEQNTQKDRLEKNNYHHCSFVKGPIMTLGDMDRDIIKRLFERRNALCDEARMRIRRFVDNEVAVDVLNDAVQQLGAADLDVRDWFSNMASTYKWPNPEDDRWQYQVDISEGQVLLEPKNNCSCS